MKVKLNDVIKLGTWSDRISVLMRDTREISPQVKPKAMREHSEKATINNCKPGRRLLPVTLILDFEPQNHEGINVSCLSHLV